MLFRSALSALTFFAVVAASPLSVEAQEVQPRHFKVLGGWSMLDHYTKRERPFWNEHLPAITNRAISAEVPAVNLLGLKGFEVMRMLELGVFDFAHGVIGMVASESPVLEGLDTAVMGQTLDAARTVAGSYSNLLADAIESDYNSKLFFVYPYPSQLIVCRNEVSQISDLKGRKIRVYSATLGDFVSGIGGEPATIPFVEVVPSMERGVIDCAISAAGAAYNAKWHEVASHVYRLPLGWSLSFLAGNLDVWNALDQNMQEFLTEEFAQLEQTLWEATAEWDTVGLACLTNTGDCPSAPGTMTLVEPTEADLATVRAVMENVVLKNWAVRCGASCVENWNDSIGKIVGISLNVPAN